VGNFDDPLIKILCVALAITLGLAALGYAEWFEGIGIAAAVFLATFVATYSEFKNESQFRDLQAEASRVKSRVFRSSVVVSVWQADLVVGDVVLLQAGDAVPADGVLVSGSLGVSQVVLTGEAETIRKSVGKGFAADDFSSPTSVFRGSVVDEGEAVMEILAVGNRTQFGRLFEELAESEDRESPLQHKLSVLAEQISTLGYIGAGFIAVSFLFKQFVMDNRYDWPTIVAYVSNWQLAVKDVVTSLILAIIIIVVAVPEGLPMMISLVLAFNMRKLLRSNVLVRKLLGIETAGSLNTLFLDKTGTLTRGRFDPQMFLDARGKQYTSHDSLPPPIRDVVTLVLRDSTSAQVAPDGRIVGGNASDRALLSFLSREALTHETGVDDVQAEILFTSQRKFSATQVVLPPALAARLPGYAQSEGRTPIATLVKGAPDVLVAACSSAVSADGASAVRIGRAAIDRSISDVSAHGVRVVSLAISSSPFESEDTLPAKLTYVGSIAILDETRPESRRAVALCQSAGIHLTMITGDRVETASAVAAEVGLLRDESLVLTSAELDNMSDQEVTDSLSRLAVVSRARPTDKSRLVRLAQESGRVVGMTGDGVNDSSALKRADVGFAMGSGSEVAKEAADIVVLDDNFMSLAMAVLYGRTIFLAIRRFVVFQSTVNLASTVIVFLGPFLGVDFPLSLIQLLWVNLVMDTLAAIAFGGAPALERYMHATPIRRDERIISPAMWSQIAFGGLYIAAVCIAFLVWEPAKELYLRDGGVFNEDVFLTAFFCLFIFLTSFNGFNVRTPSLNLLENLGQNLGFLGVQLIIVVVQVAFTVIGGRYLRTVPLLPSEWSTTLTLAATVIPFDLLRKIIFLPWSGDQKVKWE
jgi:calcium-translocating P-type ATPase